jgi:hypothetical protein
LRVASRAVQMHTSSYHLQPCRTPGKKYSDAGYYGVGMVRLDCIPPHIYDQVSSYLK